MKSNPYPLQIVTFLVLLFASCSKDDSKPDPQYGEKLLRVYELDTTKVAPNDTLWRHYFTYDNSNRPVKLESIQTNGNNITRLLATNEYNGADSFASRRITKQFNNNSLLSFDTTYFHFENGKYKSDSMNFFFSSVLLSEWSKSSYEYQDGLIIKNRQQVTPASFNVINEVTKIHQTLINGNIVYQLDTITGDINGHALAPRIYETTIDYLPNPNPLFRVFHSTARPYYNGIGLGNMYTGFAPFNLISQQTSSAGNVSYQYVFRADGYPIAATMTKSDGTKLKLVFEYNQL